MSKEDKNIRVITFSKYVKPEPVENISRGWALNGRNNSFYDYVTDRYRGSTTNSSIIDSYVDLVYGRGLGVRNSLQNTDAFVKLASVLTAKDIRRICFDYVIFGELSVEVIETKGKELSSIKHLPKNLVVPSLVDEDNEIKSYWFSNDWSKQSQNKPVEIPAFGFKKAPKTIFNLKPYSPNCVYFANPSYFSGLQYCESEEEISNLYLSSIKNGLSGGYIINVPDGVNLQPEEKDAFERSVKNRLTGSSNTSNFIISFNGRDVEVTITPFPVNDNIHKQWEFLTTEATQKILTAHRATSPSLVGIISSSGFSNTADEMDMAEQQLMKRVIKPKQDAILGAIEEILVAYGINLDLYFKPLTEEVKTAPAQLSKHKCDVDISATENMASSLIEFGEDSSSEDWVLLSTADVDYDTDDDLHDLIKLQFANTGTARPNAKSSQDSQDVKIRYRYVGNPLPERSFCKLMMTANKLYRKEDIIQMGSKTVNDGFGERGTPNKPYSIWFWKGGGLRSAKYPNGTCKHKWQREIYLNIKGGVDVNSPLAKTISTSEARRKGYKVPVNDSDVSVTPNKNKS
tara:strand:- start:4539 stop:6254 length:1716 start_codon:yes stop_codon:yes gene_type:complete